MPRNRMIKLEFWTDKILSKLSLNANLFYIGLWNFADDYSVLLNSNRKILGDLFPFRKDVSEKDIVKWKNELLNAGRLIRICFDQQEYLIIKYWDRHQKVPNPAKRRFLTDKITKEIIKAHTEEHNSDKEYIDIDDNSIRVYFAKEKPIKAKPKPEEKKKVEYIEFDFKGTDDEPIKQVKLTQANWDKLVDNYSTKFAIKCVCKLEMWYKDNKDKSKRTHYGDDNAKMYKWVIRAVLEDMNKKR